MSTDGMTLAEIRASIATRPGHTPILVREEGDSYVAEWEGERFEWSNPFGLDSLLEDAGAPCPRDLYLVQEDEAQDIPGFEWVRESLDSLGKGTR